VRALCLALGGCVPFVAPSGYEGTLYACDRPDLWDALIASCTSPCPGVASLEGQAEGEPFVVASALEAAALYPAELEGELRLDRLEVSGASPYFTYDLLAHSVGPTLPDAQPQTLGFDPEAALQPEHLLDGQAALELRMTVPHRTLAREAAPGSGALEVDARQGTITLSFEGSFQDEPIRGCVAVLAPEIRVP
jgi:pimeloyl-ACP methyl ester carboxylesterase